MTMLYNGVFVLLLVVTYANRAKKIGSSSIRLYQEYQHMVELVPRMANLWWIIDDAEREIVFELHVQTVGWFGFGISPGNSTCISSFNTQKFL